MKEKRMILFAVLLCLLFLTACSGQKEVDKSRLYNVYAVSKEETKIFPIPYEVKGSEKSELIKELLDQLSATPEKLEYLAPLAGGFKLLGYTLEEGQLTLNFDERYKEQTVTTEVLVRAAIVRTLTQIKGVDYVSFQVKSEPLMDSSGAVVGIMSADMFIDNAGNEINSYERVSLRLYFANETGDKLVEVNEKSVYNTNISMEKLVMEKLIAGPGKQVAGKAFPTVNPETKIVSVTVKDGVCYVNLGEAIQTPVGNVTSEVTLYSIANSLVELPNVNKVQFAINGETSVLYREKNSLEAPYERNLDLVVPAG